MHAICMFFFFNDTATTQIYTLSLHDALPIYSVSTPESCAATSTAPCRVMTCPIGWPARRSVPSASAGSGAKLPRSEEHTSELQSRRDLVCRLLLEKKKNNEVTKDAVRCAGPA